MIRRVNGKMGAGSSWASVHVVCKEFRVRREFDSLGPAVSFARRFGPRSLWRMAVRVAKQLFPYLYD